MTIWKKAVSGLATAGLLASLFATAIAPAALAAAPGTASVGSAGSVPRAGTSATAATFTFTEAANNDWNFSSGSPGTLTVTIKDSASAATVHFTGTPTLVAPGSLGASVSVADNSFTVTLTDNDPLNPEQFSVQGLKIKADGGAALGAIETKYTTGGSFPANYFDAAPKATGTLANTIFAGATSALVNVTSVCDFVATGGGNGNLDLTSPSESVAISSVTANVGGQQTLTIGATGSGHAAGTAVSQTLASCPAAAGMLASAGTVVDSLELTVENGPYGVQPGLFNQSIGTIKLAERSAPFLTVGTVITMTITTPGVVWSHSLDANTHGSGTEFELANETSTLSADRKTVTWTVGSASVAPGFGYMHENGPWDVDVAANAVIGSTVDVTVTAGSLLVVPTSVTIGYINNVIAGTAATPTVYIGENDQQTGMVTLREAAVGSFTAGGSNNVFEVCLDSGFEYFTRAPYAVVTASNLKLLNPSTLLGTTSQLGTLTNGSTCASWTIYSASTDVPASIDIRGSDTTGAVLPAGSLNGVRINVNPGAPIGTVNLDVSSGTATSQTDFATLAIATRAFRSGVIVTALSQPTIPKGSPDSLGGNITITETLTGQFRSGQDICVTILPRSGNFFIQDTLLKTANTNDRPVITATPGSGLVVGPVTIGCGQEFNSFANTTNSFRFSIVQQAFAPNLGNITISNIHYITVADAPAGSVLVSVEGDTGGGATAFQTIVSNAKIGTPSSAGTNASALGVTTVGPFTTATKIAALNRYQTFKMSYGAAAAGKTVSILVATKNSAGVWSSFVKVTSRVADSAGNVYYYVRKSSATWISVRGDLEGGLSNAVQGRWR